MLGTFVCDSPSGENWSLSNTVTHSTSCSRSLMKNWQLEFHLGFSVSCTVLVMWHCEPMVTSQYGLLLPTHTHIHTQTITQTVPKPKRKCILYFRERASERAREIPTMRAAGFQLNSFYNVDHQSTNACSSLRPHYTHTHTHSMVLYIAIYTFCSLTAICYQSSLYTTPLKVWTQSSGDENLAPLWY